MDTEKLYAPYASEHTRAFNERISKDTAYPIAGVRIPVLRRLAKEVDPDEITIRYHEDVTFKGLAIISSRIPFSDKLKAIDDLMPYMTAWDHADVIACSLKPGKKDREEAARHFLALLKEERIFARRLAIVFLMSSRKHYERERLLEAICAADSEEYYVSMAVAWALSSFYIDDKESAEPWFSKVSEATRKRAWQKVRDSRRA